MLPGLLALALWTSAASSEPPSPEERPLSLELSDEKGEAAYRPRWTLFEGALTLRPSLKAGALALTEALPYPYPVLKRSPYAVGALTLSYEGFVEAMVSATGGLVNLRSAKSVDGAAPPSTVGGPAHSQGQGVESVYADLGKTLQLGDWVGAFYAAYGQFSYGAVGPTGGDGSYEADMNQAAAGSAWLYRSGDHELFLNGWSGAESAPSNFFRNTEGPALAYSGHAGAEYSNAPGPHRWFAGAEGRTGRGDAALRPYAGVDSPDLSLMLGAEVRRSKNPFYPDAVGAAAASRTTVADDLSLGLSGRYEARTYAMAPEPVKDLRFGAELTWTPGASLIVRAAKTWQEDRAAEHDAGKQAAVEASVTELDRENVRAVIAAAPTLKEFLSSYQPGGTMGILSAAAELTSLFDRYSYNFNEGHPQNLDDVGAVYSRARASYLADTKDPVLVCLGAAQSAALVAVELGKRSGIAIEASATTVKVADESGRSAGHAAAQIKTREYGIVWVDWGRLIATHTWDTERALRLYQALAGVPALWHQLTDASRKGRHVGYLFSEEGKIYVDALTFHGELPKPATSRLFGDAPDAGAVAAERYRRLLRARSEPAL